LLGRRVESALAKRGSTWYPPEPFDWDDKVMVRTQLEKSVHAFADEVRDRPWQVAWCAGAGIVGSGSHELKLETEALSHLLRGLVRAMGLPRMSSGQVFLASSAGGVYGGSGGAPYNEHSAESPLAAYGFNKLEQESLVRRWSRETGTPVLIGRLTNIYGPGQNLSKSQGLVSEVCRRTLAHQPFVLYVPLDTIRDYIYVDDASALIADGLDRLRLECSAGGAHPAVVKILASRQGTTIATVLSQIRQIIKRPVRVVLASSPYARRQAPDLRMSSVVWPELDRRPMTTLSAGIRAVLTDILDEVSRGNSPRV
jgi:UDP-glucose 4-epimerase